MLSRCWELVHKGLLHTPVLMRKWIADDGDEGYKDYDDSDDDAGDEG